MERAKKALGQNFLRDESVIKKIVAAAGVTRNDRVIEIGPGHGALTEHLVETAGEVIAIEFDRDLIRPLSERFASQPGFQLVNEDALTVDFHRFATGGKLKLVANLPYNISTPILQRLIRRRDIFSTMVLMFQREVAGRITAKAGSRDRGFLTVLVENAFDVEYLFDVPPASFYPVPKVWSAVVRLTPIRSAVQDETAFVSFISTAFAHKRKTLSNNLKARYADAGSLIRAAEIDPGRRAETLSVDQWRRLFLLSEKHKDC